MRSWSKIAVYLFVVFHISMAVAGAYEDFFIAVKRNNGRAVAALLERGFDPNTRDPQGQLGLVLALRDDNPAVAEALMASPELQVGLLNAAGESALMMAALKGQMDWTERLLARGAPINQAGWTPLHYAATGPEPAIVRLLLDRGATVDTASPNGNTALMMAARYGKEESVMLLLARGADPRRMNALNMTAADVARRAGRDKLADQLGSATK